MHRNGGRELGPCLQGAYRLVGGRVVRMAIKWEDGHCHVIFHGETAVACQPWAVLSWEGISEEAKCQRAWEDEREMQREAAGALRL